MNYRKTLVASVLIHDTLPESAGWMLETAKLHGIEVSAYTEGPWTNLTDIKIHRFYQWAKQQTGYDYILFVDGDDCLFATDLAEIHHHFDSFKTDFVMSAEMYCFPWQDRWAQVPDGGRFKFANAGQWMGTWDGFIRSFNQLMDIKFPPAYRGWESNDQSYWQYARMEKSFPLTLDHDCKIAQSMIGLDWRWTPHNREIAWGKRPRNLITGSYPCIFHGNGGDKWRLKDVHEMLTG